MEENKEFIKGFNQGYFFQKERPVLARQIIDSFQDTKKDYRQGFIAGSKQYAQERGHELLKERSGNEQNHNLDRER